MRLIEITIRIVPGSDVDPGFWSIEHWRDEVGNTLERDGLLDDMIGSSNVVSVGAEIIDLTGAES